MPCILNITAVLALLSTTWGCFAFLSQTRLAHDHSTRTRTTVPVLRIAGDLKKDVYLENSRRTSSSFYATQTNQESSSLVFVFNGQGSQWKKMGADLIETSSAFRSTMERLQASSSLPLVDLYKDGSKWLSKEYSTIGIVSFQLGLLAILRDHGVQSPDYFLGHSVGELVCPFLAGLASEEEVLQYAVVRTRLSGGSIDPDMRLDLFENEPVDGFDYIVKLEQSSSDGESTRQLFVKRKHKDSSKDPSVVESFSMDGQMVVVGCSATDIDTIITTLGLQETRVACYNAPLGQTVSGAAFEVDRLIDYLQQHRNKVYVRKIDTDSVAYHAIYLKVFREFLRAEFGKVRGQDSPSGAVPPEWISTSRNEFFNSDYMVENMLRPVYFQEAIELLPKGSTIVEVGPSSILLSQIKRIRSDFVLFSLVDRKESTSLDVSLQHLQEIRCKLLVQSNAKDDNENGVNQRSNLIWKKVDSDEQITSLLVCGDGDLSFSASIAETLQESNLHLTATVLEDREAHQNVYERSSANEESIASFDNHRVRFGVDVTYLEDLFPDETFDRIQFNFPHWRGKANHRYNRQLIDAFLKSASRLLTPSGEIHMALVQGQGGSSAKTMAEYRDTWTPNLYAANHGLLLSSVKPFEAVYNLSSHRGVDRGFKIGKKPKLFIFTKPNGSSSIPKRNQLCCRHELHVLLPRDDIDEDECTSESSEGASPSYSMHDIVDGDAVQSIIENIVPDGIRVEVPSRDILKKIDTGYETNMAVFMIVYCGDYKALCRDEADRYRHLAEIEVEKHMSLRENRKGRLISKPFPYYLLDSVVEDTSSYGMTKAKGQIQSH